MTKHKSLVRCCIGMGTVAFYDRNGNPTDHDDKRVQPAENFVYEYECLKLTGIPARFTRDGKVQHQW